MLGVSCLPPRGLSYSHNDERVMIISIPQDAIILIPTSEENGSRLPTNQKAFFFLGGWRGKQAVPILGVSFTPDREALNRWEQLTSTRWNRCMV